MKNLKINLVLVLLLGFFVNTIQAQSGSKLSQEQKEEIATQLKANKERLALTPEQEEPFKEITKKYMSKLAEVKDGGASRKEKFQKIKELQDQKNEDMKSLLSESQYATFLQIQSERKAKVKERRNQN